MAYCYLLLLVFQIFTLSASIEIDAVYTWVNSDDELWKDQYRQVFKEEPEIKRFKSNNELLYSLRSIETFAPFIKNIYIVTNGQVPSFIDFTNPRIKLVSHAEIYK
jgi:hypothetical protein